MALEWAVENHRNDVVGQLLDKDADPNWSDSERHQTALYIALLYGNLKAARLLLAHGANVNAADVTGNTPLHSAVVESSDEVVDYLLQSGADPNKTNAAGHTPLDEAAETGRLSVVKAFLDHGADPTLRDKLGRTALDLAEDNGRKDVVALLKSKGAPHGKPTTSTAAAPDGIGKEVLEFRLAVPRGKDTKEEFRKLYEQADAGKVLDLYAKMHMDGDASKPYYLVRTGPPALTGGQLAQAYMTTDQFGMPAVGFEFSPTGSRLFSELTAKHHGWALAIIADGVLRSAPVMEERIAGSGIIHGHFTQTEVEELVEALQTRPGQND
jgi:hypothetical protein